MDTIRDEQNNPVVSHLDEELLQQVANATKGFYLPLRGTKTMDTLYERGLAPLPKSESAVKMFQHFQERFHWPLSIAILLLIVEMFLPDRKQRRRSRSAANQAASAGLTEVVAVLMLLAISMAVHGSPASALREYNDGNYDASLKDYDKALEKKKDDPRLHFNAGAAAYQSKQLDQAEKEFNEALASPDLLLRQRAYYNLGNTLYRKGQGVPDAQKKQETWETALKQYQSALKLNQQDSDAKFNHEFVQKQLEELKKQQQKSQQSQSNNGSKQNQKQDKNKQDQQDKQNQEQNKQDQSKQDQEKSKQEQNQARSDQQPDKQQGQQSQDKTRNRILNSNRMLHQNRPKRTNKKPKTLRKKRR